MPKIQGSPFGESHSGNIPKLRQRQHSPLAYSECSEPLANLKQADKPNFLSLATLCLHDTHTKPRTWASGPLHRGSGFRSNELSANDLWRVPRAAGIDVTRGLKLKQTPLPVCNGRVFWVESLMFLVFLPEVCVGCEVCLLSASACTNCLFLLCRLQVGFCMSNS